MALLNERGGSVRIRCGGNSQDYATVVPSLPSGKDLEKDKAASQNPVCSIYLLYDCPIYVVQMLDANTKFVYHAGAYLYVVQYL